MGEGVVLGLAMCWRVHHFKGGGIEPKMDHAWMVYYIGFLQNPSMARIILELCIL